MNKVERHWVTFYYPGFFFAETSNVEMPGPVDPKSVEFPEITFLFTVHKREDIEDGEDTFNGKAVQVGGKYFHPDTEIVERADLETHPEGSSILASNIGEGKKGAYCVCGNWQEYDPQTDIVL